MSNTTDSNPMPAAPQSEAMRPASADETRLEEPDLASSPTPNPVPRSEAQQQPGQTADQTFDQPQQKTAPSQAPGPDAAATAEADAPQTAAPEPTNERLSESATAFAAAPRPERHRDSSRVAILDIDTDSLPGEMIHDTSELDAVEAADAAVSIESVELKIRRQDDPFSPPYWQHFALPYFPRDNVVAVLRRLRVNPITSDGERVDPVVFDHNCMEEVCGACAMMINGQPRPACSALIDELKQPVVLEPLPKFPLVRDLLVDRSSMFEHLKHVQAWVRVDGPWAVHQPSPRVSQQQWAKDYLFSRCMSCGCCLAACPQYDDAQDFVGPAALAQVRLMNAQPTGRFDRTERLHRIMGQGGLSDCGNAQNCVRVCPKEIPLTTAIGELGRATTIQALKDLFGD